MKRFVCTLLLGAALGAQAQGRIQPTGVPRPPTPSAGGIAEATPGQGTLPASPAPSAPQPKQKSAYAVWDEKRATNQTAISTLIRENCAKVDWKPVTDVAACSAAKSFGTWCGCYFSKDAEKRAGVRDMLSILETPPLRVVYFLHHRDDLTAPLDALAALVPAISGTKVKVLSSGNLNAAGATAVESLQGALPALDLGAIVQNALAGLALALKTRAEQEATAYLFDQMQSQLCTNPEVKPWLPSTCAVLGTPGTSIGSPDSMIALLKSSFTEDLRNAPAELVDTAVAHSDGETKEVLRGPLDSLLNGITHGGEPLAALQRFDEDLGDKLQIVASQPIEAKKLPFRVLQCIAGFPPALARVNPELADAMKDVSPALSRPERDLALALLAFDRTECDFIERRDGTAPLPPAEAAYFDRLVNDAAALRDTLHSFSDAASDLEAVFAQARALKTAALAAAAAPAAATTTTAAGTTTTTTPRDQRLAQAAAAAAALAAQLANAFDAAAAAVRTCQQIARRHKAAAGQPPAMVAAPQPVAGSPQTGGPAAGGSPSGTQPSAPGLPASAAPHPLDVALLSAQAAVSSATDASRGLSAGLAFDFAGAWREVARHLSTVPCAKGIELSPQTLNASLSSFCVQVDPAVLQIGSLLVAVAQAQTPDEVKNAILSAAEPIDSWKAQYDPAVGDTWSLGGLVGIGLTGKAATTPTPGAAKNDFFQRPLVGIFGVEWTREHAGPWSTGIFLQALDLGGYLHDNGNNVRPLQALSPGIWLRLGVFKSPFVLAIGGAYDVDDGTQPQAHGSARGGALVAVDTRLWTLSRGASAKDYGTGTWADEKSSWTIAVSSLAGLNGTVSLSGGNFRLYDRPLTATLGFDVGYRPWGAGVYLQMLDFIGYAYPVASEKNGLFRGVSPGFWLRERIPSTPFVIAAGLANDFGNADVGSSWRAGALVAVDVDWIAWSVGAR
ncbi:MAG TPA: hypothetical protein VGH20_13055 [Myxococcales bacterium]